MDHLEGTGASLPAWQAMIQASCHHPSKAFRGFKRAEIEQSIPSCFEERVRAFPEQIAIKSESGELTYAQLNELANHIARAVLARLGSGQEAVLSLFETEATAIAAILGTLKAGKFFVALDPIMPQARLKRMVKDSDARLILTNSNNLALAGELSGQGCRTLDVATASSFSGDNLDLTQPPHSLAYIVYTSGSTGHPKGVVHSHRNLLHNSMCHIDYLHICHNDRMTLLHACNSSAAYPDIFGALLSGATLYPWDLRQEGWEALEGWLLQEEITIFNWAATPFRHFVAGLEEPTRFPSLRIVMLGSEPIFKRDLDLYKAHTSPDCVFIARFGCSEAIIFRYLFLNHESCIETNLVPAGYPVVDKEVLLLDDGGTAVGVDCIGEISVRSAYLALGYWRDPELTGAAFLIDAAREDRRIYRTGDMGTLRADGCLEFLGRRDFQIKIRGYRIELAEIEMALGALDAVKEAVVVAKEGENREKWLAAYYVPSTDPAPSFHELRSALSRALPDYMIPSTFVRLDALPLTPAGKVDRQALRELDPTGPDLEHSFIAPRSPVEEILAGIWAEVLELQRVGIHSDFFELGGHSLLAAQVLSRIRDALQVNLLMRSLFDRPTIAGLAKLIETEHKSAREVLTVQPAPREQHPPLSLAQEPMWFLSQLEPGNAAYNLGKALRLSGPLDVPALRQSLNEIVQRHESLRTNFAVVDGQPAQIISPALVLELPIMDLQGLPMAEQEARARQLVNAEAGRSFDLEKDLLVRAKLLRLGEDDHVLSLCIHHLVTDGWSTGVLFRELSALYQAFSKGESSPLAELPVRYADYAISHRRWLKGPVLDSQISYWKQQLSGAPPDLQLPRDGLRPAIQTYRGARRFLTIPGSIYQGLKALCQRERCTLFMVLLGAFKILLHRYTGQDDIVIGSPIASRNRPELENLIGLFLNMLVLRTDLSGNPTFREFLARVREVTLAAYEHQDVPFERLVEALKPPRDPSRSPLFQVMLEVSPSQVLELEGVSVSPLNLDNGSAQFDLSVRLREGEGGVWGHFEYNTDLFESTTVDHLVKHFQMLLEGIARDPEQRIAELRLLSDPERHKLLVEWNDTHADYPQDRCLHELFEAQAARTPDAIAVSFEGEHLTYQRFNARANQLAHHLQKLGVKLETLVGVYMERSLEMVTALYGILKAGGAYVPLDPEYPADRVAFMLRDAQVPVLLTQQRLAGSLPTHRATVLCLDSQWETLAQENDSNLVSDVGPDNLAYVIYTSGSTGKPKGVMNTHGGICNRLLWMQDRYQLTASDRVLQKTPFSFDVSVWEFFWSLLFGARLIVARPGGHKDTAYLVGLIGDQEITTIHFVPSMLQLFLEERDLKNCTSLRRVICSGEALPYDLQERFFECLKAELHNLYGPTEAAVDVTHWQCQPEGDPRRSVPIGRPVANTQLYILDPYGQPVPIGVGGELHIGGVQVARGYLNRPELTAETFVPDPFSKDPEARLYKTGDLARYRPDGNIEFLGRLDFQVKVRGFRIELGEIEAVLSQHPTVREVVVLAREESPGDRRLVAYVVPAPASEIQSGILRDYLHSKLPDYMVPAAFVQLEALPLLPNGKVDRRSLPTLEWEHQATEVYVPPSNDLEKAIAGIWRDLLPVDQVGLDDSFFELGGHSLLIIQAHRRLSEMADRELSITDLFRYPTVRALSQYLGQRPGDGDQISVQQTPDRAQARREAMMARGQRRRRVRKEIADEPG